MPADAALRAEIQRRCFAAPAPHWPSVKALFRKIQTSLQRASNEGDLKTVPYEVSRLTRLKEDRHAAIITGGGKGWNCKPDDGGVFRRRDGAWFTFVLQVAPTSDGTLQLESYSFQLCLGKNRTPPYLRFDLDGPGHVHEGEGLRSHLHPGASATRVPAPVLHPLELLDLFLYGLRGESASGG